MMRLSPLAAAFLLACHAAPPPEPPPAPPAPEDASSLGQPAHVPKAPPSFDGPAVPLSPPLHDAVEALVAHQRITSAKIGAGGEPSASYAAYEEVVAVASPAEELALIDHPDPIVRGYLGGHLARRRPGHLHELSDVLRDPTPVDEQHGCMVGRGTVARYVTVQLCNAIHLNDVTASEAQALLVTLAADTTSPVQAEAQRCLDGLP